MAQNTISFISQLWLPFLATAGASLTVLAIQSINRYVKEQRQRIFAIGYMADVALRTIHSELILHKHTIAPHIKAVKRMLSGEQELLELALDTDEFDILTADALSFPQLLSDHKILVGYDNIKLIQAFDTLLYMNLNESSRVALNNFVAENLKSKKRFFELSNENQQDMLNTYLNYLRAIEHDANRIVAFTMYIFAPMLKTYIETKKFRFFSTKDIAGALDNIQSIETEFREFIPQPDFFEQSMSGGIQGAL